VINRSYEIKETGKKFDYNVVYDFPNLFKFKDKTDNVCTQSIFDGETVFIPNVNAIILKKANVVIDRDKLLIRGRHQVWDDTNIRTVEYITSLIERQEKYTIRGFHVNLIFDMKKEEVESYYLKILKEDNVNFLPDSYVEFCTEKFEQLKNLKNVRYGASAARRRGRKGI
jgi:hypothetical protein